MIKNIIFDIGRVLVYFDPAGYVRSLGFDEETQKAVANAIFFNPLWIETDRGVIPVAEFEDAFVANAPDYEPQIREAYRKMGRMIEMMPHSLSWVKGLKEQGYHVYLLSNYGEYLFQESKHKLDFMPYVDGAVISYQIQMIKPDREIYEYLLDKYGLIPEECVFIDDRPENVEGAAAVGMQGIQFEDYEQADAELRKLLHTGSKSVLDRFEFRNILSDEADQAVQIEQICFPPNEACSEAHMKERIARAPELFLVAVDRETGKLAGFLNGLSTNEGVFRDEFFTDADLYDPEGKNVMLLGLDVLPEYRRQGLARELMNRYLRREREKGRSALILTCLEAKVKMYEKMGFQDLGLSNSSWGGEAWHEMRIAIGS